MPSSYYRNFEFHPLSFIIVFILHKKSVNAETLNHRKIRN
ncbi:MAG: hypothetical protein DAHOPDDO_01101 [Ignavibacteriaceae bacterium]|nr:hypothetical protein [Ignavibacteriaceae bacterium]